MDVDVGWVVPLALAGGAAAPVGTNVAEGSERQELAAALAAETEVGAWGFTVPFPAKEQEAGLRLLAS